MSDTPIKVSEVHHVAINVTDLERSIAFYEEALGYRTTVHTTLADPRMAAAMRLRPGTTGRAAILQGDQRIGQIELIEWTPAASASPRPSSSTQPGVLLISFEVATEDLQPLHSKLVGLGADCYSDPVAVEIGGYGSIGAFLAEDPDGTVLEFIALPG